MVNRVAAMLARKVWQRRVLSLMKEGGPVFTDQCAQNGEIHTF